MTWIRDRLLERSTWLGLVALLTALGVSITPELAEAIATAGLAVGGIIAAVTKDK